MCVILKKNPGSEIPFEHLLASAHRNNDGYGVVVHANGQLKSYGGLYESDPEKAAKEVQKVLEDAKNELAFVHFRLRTVGALDIENLQPIPVLSRDSGDAIDVSFLHNGTIDDFRKIQGDRNSGPSDSLLFSREIVGPLLRRSAAFLGPERILEDPFITTLLPYYSSWSRFALVDSNGKSLIINEKAGVAQDYGWASNEYSLKPENVKTKGKIIYPGGFVPKAGYSDLTKKMNDNLQTDQSTLRTAKYQRETVNTATGFNLEDFHYLSEYEIEDMVERYPKLGALLLLDLIEYHYNQRAV